MDAEFSEFSYYCEVRWVSRVAMLPGVYALSNAIAAFIAQKGFDMPKKYMLTTSFIQIALFYRYNSKQVHLLVAFGPDVPKPFFEGCF